MCPPFEHSRCVHKLSLLQLRCFRLNLTLHEPWRHDRGKTISMSGAMICKQQAFLSSEALAQGVVESLLQQVDGADYQAPFQVDKEVQILSTF